MIFIISVCKKYPIFYSQCKDQVNSFIRNEEGIGFEGKVLVVLYSTAYILYCRALGFREQYFTEKHNPQITIQKAKICKIQAPSKTAKLRNITVKNIK